MTFKQDPPFAVQVELSEGCNLYCDFCGLQGIREKTEKNFKFMTVEDARAIAKSIRDTPKWNPRIEFAMHGEPTMNPDMVAIVRAFRKRLPKTQLMMTSNGGGLLGHEGPVAKLTALFDAGLNVFAFDAYEYVKIKDKIDAALEDAPFATANRHTGDYEEMISAPFEIHRYPDQKEFSPHNRYGPKARKFIRVQDISVAASGTHSVLNNHCGAGAPGLKEPMQARCAKPFRELSIRYNGDVAICCNDWRGVFKVGNVVRDGVDKVWNSELLHSARRFLMRGDRGSVKPCNICNAKSYRVGLLPDKMGKKNMRKPNEDDVRNVELATSMRPLAEVVVRPWEIKRKKHV